MGKARATFTVTPKGKAEIARFKKLRPKMIRGLKELLLDTALDIRNTIITSMEETPKTGKKYKKPDGRIHTASSPGNPPAVDNGNLKASIALRIDSGGDDFSVEVGSAITDPKYPLFLETGTRKMKPRPWLSPAVESNLRGFDSKIRRTLDSIR